jgi:hypothetical protein
MAPWHLGRPEAPPRRLPSVPANRPCQSSLPRPRKQILDLTRDQIIAGEACGCVFTPATEAQVQRLTVQRRIFRLDGQPVVVTRDGGFFETHSTLVRLIEPQLRAAAPGPAPDPASAPAPAPLATPEPEAATALPAAPPVAGSAGEEPAPAPSPARSGQRRRRASAAAAAAPDTEGAISPDPVPAAASAASAPVEDIEAAARSEAEEMLGELAAAGPSGGAGAKVIRRFGGGGGGGGGPRAPRWMTAGKARRGRLK